MQEFPNWFKICGEQYFKKYLHIFKDKPNLNFLQIGVFVGNASQWIIENILSSTSSFLYDLDTWNGSVDKPQKNAKILYDWKIVENEYDSRFSNVKNIIKVKTDSLSWLPNQDINFDFIYIDAGHTSLNVFADAILSWEILKPQGILAFDDYTWNDGISPEHCPKKGIDIFLKIKEGKYEILEKYYQVWIKKI